MTSNSYSQSTPTLLEKRYEGKWIPLVLYVLYSVTHFYLHDFGKVLPHGLWFVWLFSVVVLDSQKLSKSLKSRKYSLFFIFLLFYFFTSAMGVGLSSGINRTIAFAEVCSPILMFDLYRKTSTKKMRFVVIFFVLILLFNAYFLYQTVNNNLWGLNGLRNIGDFFEENSALANVFHLLYAISMTTMMLFYIVIHNQTYLSFKKRGIVVCCLLLIIIFFSYIIIRSLYMTTLLSLIMGLFLSLMYGRQNWILKTLVILITFYVSFAVLYDVVVPPLLQLAGDNGVLQMRFEEIHSLISGELMQGTTMGARNDLAGNSWKTFLENPLLGINYKMNDFDKFLYVTIGNHSQWIDDLARYGVFSIVLFSFIYKSMKPIWKDYPLFPLFAIYVFIGIFNPVFYFIQNSTIFFYLPMFFAYLTRKAVNGNHSPNIV
jgi:hypothetical protein